MFRSLLPVFLFGSTALSAQVRMPALSRVGIDELAAQASTISDPQKLTDATQGYYPTAFVHGQCTVGFLAKVNDAFDPMVVDANVVHIGSRIGDIVSLRVDAYHLSSAGTIPGVDYLELAGKVKPTLDKLVKATHADSVQKGIDLPQTYTGREVLIGITDWGFDYTHPMFYDTLLTTSRVRAAWDQFRQAGPAPAGYTYGTELTTTDALLAAQSDTVNVYSHATHGSHVAGICGGSGAGTAYRGIAFDSKFVFCTFLVDAAAVLDAFAWMKHISEVDQKRLVINMSWGLYYMGTLDGHSLISQAIDTYSDEGITFVNSAGNNGDVNFHLKHTFTNDTLRSRIGFDSYTNPKLYGESLTMWGEQGGAFSAGLTIYNTSNQVLQEGPWYHTATQSTYVDTFLVQGSDTVFYNLTSDAADPLNGRPHFRLRVKNTHLQYRIVMKAKATTGTVHFWNVAELKNDVGNWGEIFGGVVPGWTPGDAQYGIGEPACTEGLISVAAYSSEYTTTGGVPAGGGIASFSSNGPIIDGRMKPDITAPGVDVASSISSFTDNSFTAVTTVPFNGRNYPFARFSGTSMSSPAVTGIVALLLEARPDITPAQIKEVLKSTARTDSYTGVIPAGGSTRWGAGKVNAYQAVKQAFTVSVQEHAGPSLGMWPVPASDELYITSPFSTGSVKLTVSDVTGRAIHMERMNAAAVLQLSTAKWTAGVYVVRVERNGEVALGRVVKE